MVSDYLHGYDKSSFHVITLSTFHISRQIEDAVDESVNKVQSPICESVFFTDLLLILCGNYAIFNMSDAAHKIKLGCRSKRCAANDMQREGIKASSGLTSMFYCCISLPVFRRKNC